MAPQPFDAPSYLRANAAQRPGATALYDLDRRVTFAELERVVDGLTIALRERGVGEGDPVGVRLPNVWEYVALELAIPAVGGIILPLPLTLGEAEMRWALDRSGARQVIGADDLPSLFAGPTPVGPAPAPSLPTRPAGPMSSRSCAVNSAARSRPRQENSQSRR